MKIIAFNGKREDYNTAKQLQDGNLMITPPRERLIHNAIKNLSTYSSNRNVENLLGIASANQYGLRANSALRKYMEENSTLSGGVFENNYWDMELQNATQKAIRKLAKNRREKFLQKYNEIFIQPQNLTSIEKKIIKYRENIINSVPMQEALADENKAKETSKALKYLDYFVASSETPLKEKAYVLLKLAHMMSDAYSIHPQLKDKKFKVFSEIINDLVIKIPVKDVFTSKDCSQEKHGSCAATSVARKTLLYEDKVAYIDTLLSELDDKTYMDVYDVTRLLEYQNDPEKYAKLRAPKVQVDKAQINYDRAIYEGYRIIDAAALNWMKIAGTVGDGTIALRDYIAFDARHKGLFFDSRILKIEDEDYASQHDYLRTLIKSLELLKSYKSAQVKDKIKDRQIVDNKLILQQKSDAKKLAFIAKIKEIAPDVTQSQVKAILKDVLDVLKLNTKNNNNILSAQFSSILNSHLGSNYDNKVKNNSELIKSLKAYVSAEEENKSMLVPITKKASDAQRLFEIGLAQREFLLTQLRVSDMDKNIYYDEYKIPNYLTQFKLHIEKLMKLAKNKPQNPVILEIQQSRNLDNAGLQKFLKEVHEDLTVNLFKEIDEKLAFYNTSYKNILIKGLQRRLQEHKNGDDAFMFVVSDKTGEIPDKKKFELKLNRIINNLKQAKTYEQIEEAIRPLGSQDPLETIRASVESTVKTLDAQLQHGRIDNVLSSLNITTNISSEEELLTLINETNDKISRLLNFMPYATEALKFPSEADLIVKLSEKKAEILTEDEITLLKNKFDKILQERNRVSNLREQGISAQLNEKVFLFTKEEKELLNKIEKAIPKFARVAKREYGIMNKIMSKKLDEVYNELGQRTGHFWVAEEGSLGLYSNECVRILEQMTGRPYHVESDFDAVIEHIKSGKGSGTSSTNVSWDEIGGHAQYIADVGTIKIKNPKTGKYEEKTVMLHDNTWGHSELRNHWVDAQGVGKTDYSRKFGPKGGFILRDSLLTGATAENFKYDVSTGKFKWNKKAIEGPEVELYEQYSFPIFWDAHLPGVDPRMREKFDKILKYLMTIGQSGATIDAFFKILEKPDNKLNVDFLNSFDDALSSKQKEILERIVKDDVPKITMEQYNKLDENDVLKIVIEKLILTKEFPELIFDDSVNFDFGNIKTHKALEKFKQKKLNEYKEYFRELAFKKKDTKGEKVAIESANEATIEWIEKIEQEKNINLKELKKAIKPALEKAYKQDHGFVLDNLLTNVAEAVGNAVCADVNYKKLDEDSVYSIALVAMDETEAAFKFDDLSVYKNNQDIGRFMTFLDKKFNPIDDDDLIETHRSLMRWNKEEFEELIKNLTFEDIGIKFDTPENVIKLIQAGSELEQKRLDKVTLDHFYDDLMKPALATASSDANIAYRNIYIDLSKFMDEKYINKYKQINFNKYKVRPAIPNLEVKSKAEIIQMLKHPIDNLQTSIIELRSLSKGRNCLFSMQKLSDLLDYENLNENKSEIIYNLNALLGEMSTDENCAQATAIAQKILNDLSTENFTRIQLKQDFELLKKEFDRILDGASFESIKAEFNRANSVFIKNIDFLIRSNVLPKYQSSVRRAFHKWASSASKENVDIAQTQEDLKEATIKLFTHHVLSNPAELFTYAVKFTQEKPKEIEDEMYVSVKNALKEHLYAAYQKVNRIKLEYKLMSLAAKGNASKLRDYLNNNVRTKDAQGFLDAGGMVVIRTALQDPSNNNSSLVLFVEQTGLIDALLNSIYSENLSLNRKIIRKVASEGVNVVKSKVYLKAFFKEFLAQNNNVETPTKEDLLKSLDVYLELLLHADISKPMGKYIDTYWNNFKEIAQNLEIPPYNNLNSILASINENCLSKMDDELLYAEQELNGVLSKLYSDINLLNSMKLLDNGTDEGKREAHIEKIYKVIDYVHACGKYLAELRQAEYSLE